jgi:hypothetical protein
MHCCYTIRCILHVFSFPINNKVLVCFPLIVIGLLDLITTLLGVLFFGAVEINPLFSALVQTNILVFVGVKSSVVFVTGFLFYKGASIVEVSIGERKLETRLFEIGYLASMTLLVLIVTNNVLTILQLL